MPTDPAPPPAAQPPLDRLAFLHIPKTAGTSLTHAFARHWQRVRIIGRWEQLRDTRPDGLDDITLFAGHFFAHQLAHPALARFTAATVLRDPLARLLSEYRFARTTAEQGQPLTDLMRYALRAGFFEYAFCGLCAWGRHAQLFILGKDREMLPMTVPQADLLERAKRRLERFRIGRTEALEPFVAKLAAEAGIPPPALPRMLDQGAAEDGLTQAQRQVLREVLAPDYALYEHARVLSERWLQA
jgi:hypothetical protein